MNRDSETCGSDDLAAEAVVLLEAHRIMALPVVDVEARLPGIVPLLGLRRAGVA
ncbi:MAG: CBS domain-containing protein [Gemmatimonadota bacterium]